MLSGFVVERPRAAVNRLGGCTGGLVLACALAIVTSLALVGMRLLLHPGSSVVGNNPSWDFQIMTSSLSWWPWAVAHWVDPFRSQLLWPPTGFSTLWMTSVPVPALLALPITLLAGPLVAYNVWMVVAIVLAAAAAYLLCFELTAKVVPSLLGAGVFALSPYMLGHTVSEHLDLTVVFPLPLLVLLGVRYVRGKTSGPRFVAGSALLLLELAGSSLELFVDLMVVLPAVAVVAIAFGRSRRRELLRLLARLALAYAVCLPVLAPVAAIALSQAHGPVQNAPSFYSVDLLNILVPTPTLLTGRIGPAASSSSHFVGNIGERDGYIGVPLLVISLLALRSHWRRGLWIAGLLVAVALILSLGPTVTAAGRQLVSLPVSASSLPLVRDALPARMSIFAALGLSCMCAVWFANARSPLLRTAAAVVLVVSLVPDFGPPRHFANAWALTTVFAWSTTRVPTGFVSSPGWRRVVPAGSTVLVLPTRDRTAAEYWQVEADRAFKLSIPETPFVPPALAAQPTVAELADNVLPKIDDRGLAAARLRSYIATFHVAAVVMTPPKNGRWRRIVRAAVPVRPVRLGDSLVFRVPARLPLVSSSGELSVAVANGRFLERSARPRVAAWLRFDGRRGRVLAVLEHGARRARAQVLSSRGGDAESPHAAIDDRGDAAVVFLQWEARNRAVEVRAATSTPSGWRIATLGRSRLPVWSPRVAVMSDGTVLASWMTDHGWSRILWASTYRPDSGWGRPVELDHGLGLGRVTLLAAGNRAVEAWHDSRASEARVLASVYSDGAWLVPSRLASGYGFLDTVEIAPGGRYVRWRSWNPGHVIFFEAARRGVDWSRATEITPPSLLPWPGGPDARTVSGRLKRETVGP